MLVDDLLHGFPISIDLSMGSLILRCEIVFATEALLSLLLPKGTSAHALKHHYKYRALPPVLYVFLHTHVKTVYYSNISATNS